MNRDVAKPARNASGKRRSMKRSTRMSMPRKMARNWSALAKREIDNINKCSRP